MGHQYTGEHHLGDPEFGKHVDVEDHLRTLIDKLPRLVSSVDAQLVLRDQYEVTFGIYNHEQPSAEHPFALILQHWNEDTVTLGPLRGRMKQYIDAQIQKWFGLSFDQFIEQPTYVIELMVAEATERIQAEKPLMDAAAALLEKGKA